MPEHPLHRPGADRQLTAVALQRTAAGVMEAATSAVTDRLGADVGFSAIGTAGPTGVFPITIASRIRDPRIVDVRVRPSLGLGGQVLVSGRSMFVTDYESDPRISRHFVEVVSRGEGLHAVACVPVVGPSGIQALLYSGAHGRGTLGERSVDAMLELAGYAEIGLANVSAMELELELERLRERERLATTLHDSVAQRLFAIGAVARSASGTRDLDALLARIDEIETTAADARRELRDTLLQLDRDAEPLAFDMQFDGELRLFETQSGCTVQIARTGSPRAMPRAIERLLADAALEGARNAVKHARARLILVELSYGPRSVELAVREQLFDVAAPRTRDSQELLGTGAGLRLLSSRAARLGGTLELELEGSGAAMRLALPLMGGHGRMKPLKVLVVDDHPLARRGLKLVVEESLPIEEIMEADSAAAALVIAREQRPDLVLMDMYMPESIPARELCGYLRAALPDARIVLVTAFDRLGDIGDCLAAGASGCLLKDTSEIDLGASLMAILAGETVIDPRIGRRLDESASVGEHPRSPGLTSRERDVLALLAEGCSNRRIGERLHLSEATVKGYVTSLLEKLGVSSRLEAVVHAARSGLLEPREMDHSLRRAQ